jgi:hypothetical protein
MLLAILPLHKRTNTRKLLWFCICDCGNYTIKTTGQLRGKCISCGCIRRIPDSATNCILDWYKRWAKKRHLSWKLPTENFKKLLQGKCFYCGVEHSNVQKGFTGKRFKYNGVDRLVNSEGYTKENCVSCCKTCNMMKKTMPIVDFLRHIQRILLWQTSEKPTTIERITKK